MYTLQCVLNAVYYLTICNNRFKMAGLLLKSFCLFVSSQCQGEKKNKAKAFKSFYELVKGTGLFQRNDIHVGMDTFI